jgi:hypothetical protein
MENMKLQPKGMLLVPFAVIALFGFFASLIMHVGALFGVVISREIGILGYGVVLTLISVIIVSSYMASFFPRKNYWRAALRGAENHPKWMKTLAAGIAIYVILNFVYFLLIRSTTLTAQAERFLGLRMVTILLVCSYFMIFSILYSDIKNQEWACPNKCPKCNHYNSFVAKYCETCGTALNAITSNRA